MIDLQNLSMERAAGLVLILVAVATLPGFMMFWLRRGHWGGSPRSRAHFVWERSFIMSGAILAAIGFVLLAGSFQNTGGRVLATIGATTYLFGEALLVAIEARAITSMPQIKNRPSGSKRVISKNMIKIAAQFNPIQSEEDT